MCTCVKVEDARSLPLHRDGHVVALNVGGADASVRQLDLKETAAELHAVQCCIIQARLNVRLVGVEGLMEDVLHDLDSGSGKKEIREIFFRHKS